MTDRRARPVLSPIKYFHQFITDEMTEEIVENTTLMITYMPRFAWSPPPARSPNSLWGLACVR